jgi:hypothetical protein
MLLHVTRAIEMAADRRAMDRLLSILRVPFTESMSHFTQSRVMAG